MKRKIRLGKLINDKVSTSIYDSINIPLRSSLWDSVDISLRSLVSGSIMTRTYNSANNSVYRPVCSSVRDSTNIRL